jgi:peptide deformylase
MLSSFLQMALLDILIYPDPRLKQVAQPVTSFDATLHRFLDDLKETMYYADGVGLAATQVGTMTRVAVIDTSDERNQPIELINPRIVARQGKIDSREGCLSIPDFRETITRSARVHVHALDRFGKPFEFEAEELLAYCVQHELDHLDGILFVDHLSNLKKQIFLKWLQKQEQK